MIHEWGHFIAAKKSGVIVEEFAVGMGPKIWGKQKGETLYSIRILPIGGFCKMSDEDVENSDKKGFNSISVWKRMVIILAGVFMNFLLAIVINAIIVMFTGYGGNEIYNVVPNSVAEQAGIQNGDEIVELDDSSVHLYDDISFRLAARKSENFNIGYIHDGQYIEKNITLKGSEKLGIEIQRKAPVFGEGYDGYERTGFFESLYAGAWKSVYMVKITFYGLSQLFTMQVSLDDVAGPIGLTTVVNDVYQEAIQHSVWDVILQMAQIAALLSANLGVMNILPIPALDGGRFVFLVIEAIRRKPIQVEKEGFINLVGFVILMAFGIIVAFNDVFKLL